MTSEPEPRHAGSAIGKLERSERTAERADDVFWASVPVLALMYAMLLIGFLVVGAVTGEWLDVAAFLVVALGGVVFYRTARRRRLERVTERNLIAESSGDATQDLPG